MNEGIYLAGVIVFFVVCFLSNAYEDHTLRFDDNFMVSAMMAFSWPICAVCAVYLGLRQLFTRRLDG